MLVIIGLVIGGGVVVVTVVGVVVGGGGGGDVLLALALAETHGGWWVCGCNCHSLCVLYVSK